MSGQASQPTTAPQSSGGASTSSARGSVNGPSRTRASDPIADAMNFDSQGTIDIVRGYPWTPSLKSNRNDIPEIILHEHRNNESAIKRNVMFYANGLGGLSFDIVRNITGFISGSIPPSNTTGSRNLLDVYKEIFPDNPTGNIYYLPYFTKSYMELNSPPWEQLDDIGTTIDQLTKSGSELADFALGTGTEIQKKADALRSAGGAAKELAMTALRWAYPIVGVYDRPRIFSSHDERTVTIQFPLYNTLEPNDWIKNRNFIYKLMVQSLYTKSSFITGYPPVFYRVLVPGQYFSFASCITNFSVDNLGNIRKLYGYNVPDAFQVSITLREMCMPSSNQFRAMASGEAAQKINVSIAAGLAPGARRGPAGELI